MNFKKNFPIFSGKGQKLEICQKEYILDQIKIAVRAGARVKQACKAIGISHKTITRWKIGCNLEDNRHGPTNPENQLSPIEEIEMLKVLNSERFCDYSPYFIVATLADEGSYLCSESTMYRLLRKNNLLTHRQKSKKPTNYSKTPLIASGPNQIWSWDTTYLKAEGRGRFYFL